MQIITSNATITPPAVDGSTPLAIRIAIEFQDDILRSQELTINVTETKADGVKVDTTIVPAATCP